MDQQLKGQGQLLTLDAVDKFYLRAKSDLLVQTFESVGIWGVKQPQEIYRNFESMRARPCIIKKETFGDESNLEVVSGPLWDPKLPSGRTFTYAYCAGTLDDVHPHSVIEVLKAIKKHTTCCSWFAIDADRQEVSYWGHTFARLFPRYSLSVEGRHIIVVAHSDRRWV